MFTGLVQDKARVEEIVSLGNSLSLSVNTSDERIGVSRLGDSVAVNGLCLTVVDNKKTSSAYILRFDVSEESLKRSNLSRLNEGSSVHLEKALSMGDSLGGHLVTGHIDAVGVISKAAFLPGSLYYFLEIALEGDVRKKIAPYLVEKGSIAVDGVSLTVNAVRDTERESFFEILLIPHTLEKTHLGTLKVGDLVNLEADMLAKYAARAKQAESFL